MLAVFRFKMRRKAGKSGLRNTDSKGRLSSVALCECAHRTERGGEHQTLPNAWRIRKTI